ncbi:MAG: UDP-glucose 4-epimerase [Thermoprotei archaeon]|nr:MAG: UDP-glucose 4-epimerase [Thermoprotei archaeon]
MELEGVKVLVTGGAGFIGSRLADKLLERASLVVVYDNFDDFYAGKENNVAHNLRNPKYRLIKADILDYETLLRVMKEVDVVFHEAAQPGVRFSLENPLKTNRVNVEGTLNVLMAAKQTGVKKVVYASSSSVYGTPKYVPMDEGHPKNPSSPYAVSKLVAEEYCRVFSEVYGLEIVSLRYFSVYGPRQRPDQAVRAFAERIARGQPPIVYGDGSQTRDFTYVDDVVEATIKAAEVDDIGGEVFNIGFGRETSIKDLVHKLIKLMEVEGKVEPEFKPSYKGDFPRTLADNSKARRVLGWEPTTSLDEGLRLFLEWFKSHRGAP